jgi:hypothetical protein
MGQHFTATVGYSGMARVYAVVGLVDKVPQLMSEAESRLSGPNGEFLASSVWADLGFANLAMREPEQAIEQFSQGLGASSTSQFIEKPRLLLGRALANMEVDDLVAAGKDLADAVTFAETKGLGLYAAHLGLGEGLLSERNGDIAAAERALTRAQEEAMSRGQRLALIGIMDARARLANTGGDAAQASAHTESTRSVVDTVAAGIADQTLRDGFVETWIRVSSETTSDAGPGHASQE